MTGLSVGTTPATATVTGANNVASGQTLALVLSSNSSAVDVTFTVKMTRAS